MCLCIVMVLLISSSPTLTPKIKLASFMKNFERYQIPQTLKSILNIASKIKIIRGETLDLNNVPLPIFSLKNINPLISLK